MKLANNKSMMINAGIVLTIIFAVLVGVRDLFAGKNEPVCAARYSKVAPMQFERAGALIKPEDIQSSADGRDIGVMNNVTFRRIKDAPAAAAMGVKLDAGSAQPTAAAGPQGGISFEWRPRGLPADVSAACLTYHIFLPADFDFDAGGTLPGLFGTVVNDGKVADRTDVRFVWGERGSIHQFTFADTPENTASFTTPPNLHGAPIPTGRWARIDQEILLNSPGVGNGATRLWIDESLRAEIRNADLRESPHLAIQGVTVDAHFGLPIVQDKFAPGRAKKAEQIWITPFELRWN